MSSDDSRGSAAKGRTDSVSNTDAAPVNSMASSADPPGNNSASSATGVKRWSLSTSHTAPPGLGDKCVVCGETGEDWPALWKHMRSHDPVPQDPRYFEQSRNDRGYLQCLICGKQYYALYHLRKHHSKHVSQRVFKCPVCPNSLKTAKSFLFHFNWTHGANVAAGYKCSECGDIFPTAHARRLHKRKHSGGDGKERCEVCFKRLLPGELKYHYYIHTGERLFTCHICEKGFIRKRSLTDHVKVTHLGIKVRERKYKECKVCGRTLRDQRALEAHVRRHTDEPTNMCCICARPFYRMAAYVRHMARVHVGEKNVQCPVCGKAFYDSAYLAQHVKVHVQEKKFKCDVCGKAFTWKHKIQDHMKTHSEERPFKCDRCGEAFKWKHHLSYHIKRKHGLQRPEPREEAKCVAAK